MLNMIATIGRLTHTPELRTTTSGKEICSFDVACERSYSANGQRETDFLPCVAWGKTAQFISQYFDKGSMIAVNGSLQTRKYQDKQDTHPAIIRGIIRYIRKHEVVCTVADIDNCRHGTTDNGCDLCI